MKEKDIENRKIIQAYNEGFTLNGIIREVYLAGERRNKRKNIYNSLEVKNFEDFRLKYEDHLKKISLEWSDSKKEIKIKNMIQDLNKLDEIRKEVFPTIHKSKRDYVNMIILKVLECDDWKAYEKLRAHIRSKKKYENEKKNEWSKYRKEALIRDDYKCVLTRRTKKLEVHHIDGDHYNNDLRNLITLNSEVHSAITNGVNALTDEMIDKWELIDPRYSNRLRKRLNFLKKYIEVIQKRGYPNARLERHLNLRKGKYYWIAVHQPTKEHVEMTEEWITEYIENLKRLIKRKNNDDD